MNQDNQDVSSDNINPEQDNNKEDIQNGAENLAENDDNTDIDPNLEALEKAQQQIRELNDKLLRQIAEFDNFRKRVIREKLELKDTATEGLMIDLLDILDDCDRASKQMENTDDVQVIKEGTIIVFNKLRKTLETKGLKEMESLGEEFDADKHEAITEIPAPSEDMIGKVVDDLMKGYYLGDKIIRHSKVVVGK